MFAQQNGFEMPAGILAGIALRLVPVFEFSISSGKLYAQREP